ncbi:Hypothetical predicted protein [Lecanosticta acicola]|uniref:Uncharacterized protein n=1 Tax=Lecanosticta acicola TaxID=111012 RepID=A0AAI8YT53_9PEZI|nr:Hypothetical predicted protein [Lecanosticta acicola]
MEFITVLFALCALRTVAAAQIAEALEIRQESHSITSSTVTPSSILSEGTFVPTSSSSSAGGASSTTASAGGTLTGQFTGADGNAYPVTSYSSMVLVAAHTLSVGGADALVGQVIVTEASQGFVANGQNITLISMTSTPTSAGMTTTMSTSSSSATTTTRGPVGQSPAAQPTQASSSGGAAIPMATGAIGVILGGMMRALML